jgi:hypothetical protein
MTVRSSTNLKAKRRDEMTRRHLEKISASKEWPSLADGFAYYPKSKAIAMAIAQHNYFYIPAIIKAGPENGGMTE